MSAFEITLLSIVMIIGFSIVWGSLKTGISPMPSSQHARTAMMTLSENTGTGPIYELGSGWGNLLIALAKKHPNRKIVAYELSFMPWLMSVTIKLILGLNNLTIYRQNFLKADLSDASVIVCFLFTEVMKELEGKLKKEDSSIEYLISNNFSLPSYTATETVILNDLYKSPIYLYSFKQ